MILFFTNMGLYTKVFIIFYLYLHILRFLNYNAAISKISFTAKGHFLNMKNKFPDCVHNDKKIANIIVWIGSSSYSKTEILIT